MSKGDDLLRKLFSSKLPMVPGPAQQVLAELMRKNLTKSPELAAKQARLLALLAAAKKR